MTETIVELSGVTFRRGTTQILDGIDLTVRPGEHWALLGSNGAGKSTVLGLCGALSHPTTGTVEVLSHRLGRVELQRLRRSIGHVDPRHPLRSPLGLEDVVITGLTGTVELPLRWSPNLEQRQRAQELIKLVGLAGRGDARWTTLSQGERGRVLIARALMPGPRLLLLDEPTTGLDVAAREQLLETIDELARTGGDLASVLVTHHLEELPVSTSHALVISRGRVVSAGPILDAVTTATISEAFGHPIKVDRADGRWTARAVRAGRANRDAA